MVYPKYLKRCATITFFLMQASFFQSISCSSSWGQSRKTEHTVQRDPAASDSPVSPSPIDLNKLDWLVGRWVGTGLGGECEEVFLPPWNGSMTGSFRFASGGELVFSEFFSITQTSRGAVLKLKHFHPDMRAWEDKEETTDFEFVRMDDNAIWFDGLTYKLEKDGRLNVWVAMKNKSTDEYTEVEFLFRRTDLTPDKPSTPQANTANSERVLEKEIIVNGTTEAAFRMWTTSEGISKFFSPDSKIELYPGGAYEMYFGLGPDEHGRRGSQGSRIVSVIENKLLIFDWPFPPSSPTLRKDGVKTHVMIQFTEMDQGRCCVNLKQYGWKHGDEWEQAYVYFDKVWPAVFKQFQKACDTPSSSSP